MERTIEMKVAKKTLFNALLLISAMTAGSVSAQVEYRLGTDEVSAVFILDGAGKTSCSFEAFGNRYEMKENKSIVLRTYNLNDDTGTWYYINYDEVRPLSETSSTLCDSLLGTAVLTTDGGSIFQISDTFAISATTGDISMSRDVTVLKKGTEQMFNTYVMLHDSDNRLNTKYEYFLPSLMFKDSSNLGSGAIGSDFTHDWILARETRMGLPLSMFRDIEKDISVSITDYNLSPSTIVGDFGNTHLYNMAIHYGSIGYNLEGSAPSIAFCFPGSEGEHSYSDGISHTEKTWALRSHIINTQLKKHNYTLYFSFRQEDNYSDAVEEHWKTAFTIYSPVIADVNSDTVMKACLDVLDYYWLEDGEAAGFPFSVYLNGDICQTTFDFGFVGMQASCGYYLYRKGIETGNTQYITKGEKVIDFWAKHCLNGSGMPRVWWDISPSNSFRNSNDLRNMQGGMEALIQAWSYARHRGIDKPEWLRCCQLAANWMVSVQHGDGSWSKIYDNNGTVIDSGTMLTSNLIRYLTYMYAATNNDRYRMSAIKAGEYCWKKIHEPYKYVGSVIDNPYVKDRESGQKMIEACLCLYDLTHDRKWLNGGRQAAIYTESYMYAWDIPKPKNLNLMSWSDNRTTPGITIISTGHSGADCGLSYNSFEYFRLYLLTGDEHFLHVARLLEKNTKNTMDYDGKLGYSMRGLQTEALRLVTSWGDGVNLWLPWVTASALDPLMKFEDCYDVSSIDDLLSESDIYLHTQMETYSQTQGISAPYTEQEKWSYPLNGLYVAKTSDGKYLSRGSNWNTRAILDDYGIPFSLTTYSETGKSRITFHDSNLCMFETNGMVYTDNLHNSLWKLIKISDGYIIQASNGIEENINGKMVTSPYLSTDDQGNIVFTANKSEASIFTFISIDQYKEELQERQNAQIKSIALNAGVKASSIEELETLLPDSKDYTSLISQPSLIESYEPRNVEDIYTVEFTAPSSGIYVYTLQAFHRNGMAQNDASLTEASMNLQNTRLCTSDYSVLVSTASSDPSSKIVYSDGSWQTDTEIMLSGETFYIPNSMSGSQAAFDSDPSRYLNTVYTFAKAGERVKITLKAGGHQPGAWTIFGGHATLSLKEIPTSVEGIEQEESADSEYYTVDGVRLPHPVKGINIVCKSTSNVSKRLVE